MIPARMLLKSWAIPPARTPMLSSFWACSNRRSISSRSCSARLAIGDVAGHPGSSHDLAVVVDQRALDGLEPDELAVLVGQQLFKCRRSPQVHDLALVLLKLRGDLHGEEFNGRLAQYIFRVNSEEPAPRGVDRQKCAPLGP